MAELIPSPSALFDQAGRVLSHKRFRWQSHSPQQHRAGTALVRAGCGWCTLLHRCNSPEDYFWLLLPKSCKKHKESLLFLILGFYCRRGRKSPSQDNLRSTVGGIHPSRASACCFSICKLYIFCCLQQTEYTYSLLSPYGSTEIRCKVHAGISFKNSHSYTEKATCRISVN